MVNNAALFLSQLVNRHAPAQTLNAQGLNCPLPLLKLKQALAQIDSGEAVYLITSDTNSPIDIKRFCLKNGHDLFQYSADGAQFAHGHAGSAATTKTENEKSADTHSHLIIIKA